MGWLYGWNSRKELIAHKIKLYEVKVEKGKYQHIPLKHCYRGNSFSGVFWIVWEIRVFNDDNVLIKTERFIECDLIRYGGKHHGFGYKDLEESSGPYYYSCPLSYLDMAPVANEKWREGVKAYHRKRSIRLEVGQVVTLKRGCNPNSVVVTSVRPLRGEANGRTYRFSKGLIESVG